MGEILFVLCEREGKKRIFGLEKGIILVGKFALWLFVVIPCPHGME